VLASLKHNTGGTVDTVDMVGVGMVDMMATMEAMDIRTMVVTMDGDGERNELEEIQCHAGRYFALNVLFSDSNRLQSRSRRILATDMHLFYVISYTMHLFHLISFRHF